MKLKAYRTILNGNGYPCLVAERGDYICDGRKRFDSPDAIYEFAVRELEMNRLAEEYVYCFALNQKCHMMGVFEVSHGTVSTSIASPREIFQKLLMLGAVQFILVHNHPSGDATPSQMDFDLTQRLEVCGNLLDVHLVDHVIIGDGNYYSMKGEENV